jgi:hypothetical protein
MAYRDNVTTLAHKVGITNDPSLREEDLRIEQLRFYNFTGEGVVIDASPMNRGGRLFIEAEATSHDIIEFSVIPCDERLRARAAEYFAELWEENPVLGKRPFLDAIRQYDQISITYKWEGV